MLQQFRAAAHAARRYRSTLALFVCIVAAAPVSAGELKPKSHREPVSYCAYELGAALVAEGINNRNQIVGTAALDEQLAQAFVWDWSRGVRLLGLLPEAAISIGSDINDRGQAVGYSGGGGILQQAFIWDERNGMRRIVALGGQSSSAIRINNLGHIMGLSSTAAEDGEHLYFRDRYGEVIDLGAGIPFGLNGFGQVGFSRQTQQPPVTSEVFVWHAKTGEERLSGFPENRLIFPSAINNNMDIVGSAAQDDQLPHAMRWTPRKGMEFLDSINETGFSQGVDVNEWGTVVGYVDFGFPIHPFVWTQKSGMRDLTTMLHPTSPTTPQAETLAARAVNDFGWIALNTSDRVGTNPRAYVLAPKFRNDQTPCRPAPPVYGD